MQLEIYTELCMQLLRYYDGCSLLFSPLFFFLKNIGQSDLGTFIFGIDTSFLKYFGSLVFGEEIEKVFRVLREGLGAVISHQLLVTEINSSLIQ